MDADIDIAVRPAGAGDDGTEQDDERQAEPFGYLRDAQADFSWNFHTPDRITPPEKESKTVSTGKFMETAGEAGTADRMRSGVSVGGGEFREQLRHLGVEQRSRPVPDHR